jgi:ASC-1-like (ASCH) protein
MRHEMKLFSRDSLDMIRFGTKTIELRLNDEKRAAIKLGDHINFTNKAGETVFVKVIGLCHFTDFEELFLNIDPVKFGYKKTDSLKYCVEFMNDIYTKAEIEKYGVLGIVIERILNAAGNTK